jgi:hypothetical protein
MPRARRGHADPRVLVASARRSLPKLATSQAAETATHRRASTAASQPAPPPTKRHQRHHRRQPLPGRYNEGMQARFPGPRRHPAIRPLPTVHGADPRGIYRPLWRARAHPFHAARQHAHSQKQERYANNKSHAPPEAPSTHTLFSRACSGGACPAHLVQRVPRVVRRSALGKGKSGRGRSFLGRTKSRPTIRQAACVPDRAHQKAPTAQALETRQFAPLAVRGSQRFAP